MSHIYLSEFRTFSTHAQAYDVIFGFSCIMHMGLLRHVGAGWARRPCKFARTHWGDVPLRRGGWALWGYLGLCMCPHEGTQPTGAWMGGDGDGGVLMGHRGHGVHPCIHMKRPIRPLGIDRHRPFRPMYRYSRVPNTRASLICGRQLLPSRPSYASLSTDNRPTSL